ncbi:MAG: sigma-70 family RNA polymerase sigma factor [Gemmatimonadales bacterium]|nr:MAG: sigma-70 family RNA polymerase sigma factor [Gemmatimonadales bacterium]
MSTPEEQLVSDAVLVRRAIGGDQEAFSELVRRYQRAAYLVALGVTRRHEDAEDVAQEAFVVALERLEECRDPDRFAGWFTTIVKNRARNLLRREHLREGEPIPFQAPSTLPGPDRETERADLRGRLSDAMDRLSPLQREVVLLHDLEGWKHREIAERLEMPSGTVRSHLHFARRRLRELLRTVDTPGPEARKP